MANSSSEFESLTRGEIEELIASTEEEIEDLAHERRLTLGGSGMHIGAREVERMRAEFESDEAMLSARLQSLRDLL